MKVLLSVFPARPDEDDLAGPYSGKEGPGDAGDVGWLDGMPVNEAFHPPDDGGAIRAYGFGLPDFLALLKGKDHEREHVALVLTALRKVHAEVTSELGEDFKGRVLFSRASRTVSRPTGQLGRLSP